MEAYPSNSHSESHQYEAATVKSREFRRICRERKWEERESCVEMKREKIRPVTQAKFDKNGSKNMFLKKKYCFI